MSASTARTPLGRPARPSAKPAAPSRPSLRLVPRRRTQAARAPFIAVIVLLLGSGLLGLLALNTLLAQDAFTLHKLQQSSDDLAAREQVLSREVDAREVPQALAAKAASLGMVPNELPTFIDFKTGRILGNTKDEKAAIPVIPVKPTATTPTKTPATTPTTTKTATTKTATTKTATTKTATTAKKPSTATTTPKTTTKTRTTTTKPATSGTATGAGR